MESMDPPKCKWWKTFKCIYSACHLRGLYVLTPNLHFSSFCQSVELCPETRYEKFIWCFVRAVGGFCYCSYQNMNLSVLKI